MRAKGKEFFGTAFNIRNDDDELGIISNTADFGSASTDTGLKWEVVQPRRGQFVWTKGDAVVNKARSNKQQVHCHTLVWDDSLPTWVTDGNFDNETLIDVMTTHVETVVGKYRGKCARWDVVNEG